MVTMTKSQAKQLSPAVLAFYGDSVYALDGANLKKYDSELTSEQDRLVLHEDCTDFIKIGSEVFLLGYDTVNNTTF